MLFLFLGLVKGWGGSIGGGAAARGQATRDALTLWGQRLGPWLVPLSAPGWWGSRQGPWGHSRVLLSLSLSLSLQLHLLYPCFGAAGAGSIARLSLRGQGAAGHVPIG